MVALLLTLGAHLDPRNHEQGTPLHGACWKVGSVCLNDWGHKTSLSICDATRPHARIDSRPTQLKTQLPMTSNHTQGKVAIVQTLLDAGADILALTSDGACVY